MERMYQQIDGYSRYFVGRNGRVWDSDRQRFLKAEGQNSKYVTVHLTSDDGTDKTFNLHDIVYSAFNPSHFVIDNNAIDKIVHHVDENKRNNRLDNLEYVSRNLHGVIHTRQQGEMTEQQLIENRMNNDLLQFLQKANARIIVLPQQE